MACSGLGCPGFGPIGAPPSGWPSRETGIAWHGKGFDSSGVDKFATAAPAECVARETLTLLKKTVTPEIFTKLTWDNAHPVDKLQSS